LASRYAGFGYRKRCLIGNIAAEASDNMPIVREALARGLADWTALVAGVIREGQADRSIEARLEAEEVARFFDQQLGGRRRQDEDREQQTAARRFFLCGVSAVHPQRRISERVSRAESYRLRSSQ
jgi:hypothetical protein